MIFQVIFIRNWQDAVIFQLRSKGGKEVRYGLISQFYLMSFEFEVKLQDLAITFQR